MKFLSNISDRLGIALKVVIFMGIISFAFLPQVKADAYRGVSFQVFYDELMPYGDWVHDPQHGFVWIPYVEQDFHPYATRGHWVMTSYGNTWVSQYDWGWAPFHYGRWFYTHYYGWAWVPGYEWGPAWVNWRTGGGYYGWAPLGPGMHINMVFNMPYNHYVFVPHRRLIHRNIHRYYLPRTQIVNVYNHTTIINNTYVHNQRTYIAGPDRRELERVNRRSIPVYQVNNTNQAGRASVSNRSVALYRPEVERGTVTQARPSRVVASSDYSRGATRTAAPSAQQRQNSAVQRDAGQEARRAPQANTSNARREAVRQRDASAPARSAAPARNAAPANVQRSAPAYDSRVSSPARQQNMDNREATPAPRTQAAQPSQRYAAPRVNAYPQQERVASPQPQQPRQAAPQTRQPEQQTRQAAPQPARQAAPQSRQAAPQQQQMRQAAPAQRSAPAEQRVQPSSRQSAPAAVSNSRSSASYGSGQAEGQSSTRSSSRSSRGNN